MAEWQGGRRRRRIKTAGFSTIEYSELQLIRRSGEDTGKLVQAAFVWLCAELFPRSSTFTQRRCRRRTRARRAATSASPRLRACARPRASSSSARSRSRRRRTTGKKGAAAANAVEIAERSLRAGTPSRALAYVQMCAGMPQPSDKGYEAFSKAQKKLTQRKQKKQLPTVTTGVGKSFVIGHIPTVLKGRLQDDWQ